MGQNPAKLFGPPTPFGQSPDSAVLNQAMAPPQAPQQNFLPLNVADPQAATPAPKPLQPTLGLKPTAKPPQGNMFGQQIRNYF